MLYLATTHLLVDTDASSSFNKSTAVDNRGSNSFNKCQSHPKTPKSTITPRGVVVAFGVIGLETRKHICGPVVDTPADVFNKCPHRARIMVKTSKLTMTPRGGHRRFWSFCGCNFAWPSPGWVPAAMNPSPPVGLGRRDLQQGRRRRGSRVRAAGHRREASSPSGRSWRPSPSAAGSCACHLHMHTRSTSSNVT